MNNDLELKAAEKARESQTRAHMADLARKRGKEGASEEELMEIVRNRHSDHPNLKELFGKLIFGTNTTRKGDRFFNVKELPKKSKKHKEPKVKKMSTPKELAEGGQMVYDDVFLATLRTEKGIKKISLGRAFRVIVVIGSMAAGFGWWWWNNPWFDVWVQGAWKAAIG